MSRFPFAFWRPIGGGGPSAPTLISSDYPVFDSAGGDQLILTLNAVTGTPTVDFDDGSSHAGTVTGSTGTTVTVTIPAGLTPGDVDVTVTDDNGTSNALTLEAFNLAGESGYTAGWGDNSFTGSPWVRNIGVSGLNMAEATNPPGTLALPRNGNAANFDGSNDQLNTTNAAGSRWGDIVSTAGTVIVLAMTDTAAANDATFANNPAMIYSGQSGNQIGIVHTSTGARAGVGTGGNFVQTAAVAASTGVWNSYEHRWTNSGNLSFSANGGTPATVSVGAATFATNTIRLGRTGGAGSLYWDGQIAAVRIYNVEKTSTTIAKIVGCLRCRYGI